MMASETQDTVYNWINSTFPGTDPDSPRKSLRLIEEAVELCLVSGATVREILHAVNRAINNDVWHPIDGRDFRPDRIPAKVADIRACLTYVAEKDSPVAPDPTGPGPDAPQPESPHE